MALPFKMYTFNQLTQFNEISNNVERESGKTKPSSTKVYQ